MKKSAKKIIAIICVFCILLTGLFGCHKDENENYNNTYDDNTIDIIDRLSIGWNLGNTLDCIDYKRSGSSEYYETLWGNPVTTKEMIDVVKNAGFKSVRVPVTWYDHVDSNGVIDSVWMNRVEEVVNYVLDNDMTCIINLHHDTGKQAWIKANIEKEDEMEQIVTSLWTQIAAHFKNYDEDLLFEGFNEILNEQNDWGEAQDDDYTVVNDLNQVFVNTVRQSGGQNAQRYLIVNTYAASTDQKTLDSFVMPEDTVQDRIITEVHFYDTGEASIDSMIKRLEERFVKKGIPVIIGEFGMQANSNENYSDESRRTYAGYLVSKAGEAGIGCFWWDNGGIFADYNDLNTYALLNRSSLEWYDEKLVDVIIKSAEVVD